MGYGAGQGWGHIAKHKAYFRRVLNGYVEVYFCMLQVKVLREALP